MGKHQSFRFEELSEDTLLSALTFLCKNFPYDYDDILNGVRGALREHDDYCQRWQLHRVRRFVLLNQDDVVATTGYYAETAERAWLSWFAVDAGLRRRGIGGELLARTMRITRDDGYADMHVYTGLGNTKAISLYERAGFRRYSMEEHDGWKALSLRQPLNRLDLQVLCS